MDKDNPIIEIKNVSKWYSDVQVLKDINLEVYNGDVGYYRPKWVRQKHFAKDNQRTESIQAGEVLIIMSFTILKL